MGSKNYFARSSWGAKVKGHWRFPDIKQCMDAADVLAVAPAWLAFNLGPAGPVTAQAGFDLGQQLAQFPGLRGLIAYYMTLSADERQAMLTLLRIPAEPEQTSGTPAEQAPASSKNADDTPAVDRILKAGYGRMRVNILPIVDRPKAQNHRDELAVWKIQKRSSRAPVKLPKWYGLACGGGRELQKCPDYIYFRELPDWKNHHSAVVRGDSMRETLLPQDIVILRMLNNSEGVALEPLDSDDLKGPMQRLQAYVPPRAICVVRINDEEPTLKRVLYHAGQTSKDWKLTIVADNPAEWEPRPIGLKDHVVFYARVIGLAQE